MQFPEGFVEKYEEILGDEARDFLASFKEEAVSAFRVNPLKETPISFPDAIPQTPWGHYGKVSGKSPEHATGLVYSQEPAAQMVAQVAQPSPGMKVLDLAAAPGGKSTQLAAYLAGEGLLVSNEISDRLAKVFKGYFDLIVLDAPCSGEGMFRKQPDAMDYWSLDYPSRCASLQREILEDAVTMLADGGRLVYSTCTWAPEENEEIVNWLLEEYDFDLLPVEHINGMVAGIDLPETARMYPHHFKGEGQFVAHLQFKGDNSAPKCKASKSNLSREQVTLWQEFAQKHLKINLRGILQTFGDQLYLLPEFLPDLGKLKIARNGLHLGTFKKKRFEPSFALGLALKPSQVKQSVEIDQEEFVKYVAGETVQLAESLPNGWYQVLVQGNGLGFGKVTGNVLKNYFPKGLRFK